MQSNKPVDTTGGKSFAMPDPKMKYTELVKAIFDIVRNYGLAALVFFGGGTFISTPQTVDPDFDRYVGWSLIVIGYLLFLANIGYSISILEQTDAFRSRKNKEPWNSLIVATGVFFGFLMLAAVSVRQFR